MTPKEKAIELIESYMRVKVYRNGESFYMTWYSARECAMVVVNEMLNTLFQHHEIDFWKDVKKELQ